MALLEGREVACARGAVAAESPPVARSGARVLAEGGNAFDAAAAACLACCMLHPDKTGVGGYVLAGVAAEGRTGRVWSLDANARAPASARAEMFRVLPPRHEAKAINETEYDCSVANDANVHGPLAVAVPGQMAGIGTLWERWGRLPWPRIVQPCLDLLADGFPYGEALVASIRSVESAIRRNAATAAHLLPGGRVPAADDRWHRPDMERTLARLAAAGWRDFYEGQVGRAIADAVAGAGGALTRQDLATYQPRITEPYRVRYRGAEVYGAILPNGPLSVLQALNMLARFDGGTPDSDPRWWHRLAEVLKRVWRDRLQYLGDPDYTEVPIGRLLSADYAAGRVEELQQFPDAVDGRPFPTGGVGVDETSHVSAADADGNAVSATITHGGAFGACFAVPGWGLILGHGMCRLDPRPGRPNSVAGGKRPLNNVATMVLRLADRDVAMGLPGGRRIISVATQLALRLVDFSASPLQAALAPRLHVTGAEPLELQDTADDGIAAALEEMGHRVQRVGRVGGHAHIAEYRRDTAEVRAGGGGWAAGL